MKPGMVFLLSGVALLLLASSLLADDGSMEVKETQRPDTTTTMPVSLIGVGNGFSLENEPDFKHSPQKSVLFSTILPGLGQAHNQVVAGEATVEEALAITQQFFDDYRACIIAHDAVSDQEGQKACLEELDPALAGLFGN